MPGSMQERICSPARPAAYWGLASTPAADAMMAKTWFTSVSTPVPTFTAPAKPERAASRLARATSSTKT